MVLGAAARSHAVPVWPLAQEHACLRGASSWIRRSAPVTPLNVSWDPIGDSRACLARSLPLMDWHCMTGQLDQTSQPCSLPACSSSVGPSWSCAGRLALGFDLRTVRRATFHIHFARTTGLHAHAHRTAQSVTAHHNVARTPPMHTARREGSGVHSASAPSMRPHACRPLRLSCNLRSSRRLPHC